MSPPTDPKADQRIAKLLARAGVASRREIERMIADGRVAVAGTVIDTPATILRSLAGVTVDGNPVEAAGFAQLFLYHKPPGLLVTERDPRGRPTIYDHLPADLPRVVPVGRLDLATEGLLLLTTDGGLKRQLELPATGVERAYRARAYGEITQPRLEELMQGIEIEGVRYGPINANLERRTGANSWIELILTEGKNREVRRVLEYLGLQVSRLIRTRYGPFILADLPPGDLGEVKQHDLVAFTKTLGTRGDPSLQITVEARGARPGKPVAAMPTRRPERGTTVRPPVATTGAPVDDRRRAPGRPGPAADRSTRTPSRAPGRPTTSPRPARPDERQRETADQLYPNRHLAQKDGTGTDQSRRRPAPDDAPARPERPRPTRPKIPADAAASPPHRKKGWARPAPKPFKPRSGPKR